MRVGCYSNYGAEEIRSQQLGREFDEGNTIQYFEQNLFLWESHGKRNSQSRLTTLWSWKRGAIHRAFEHVDLHHLIARGAPIPKGLKQSDEDLLQRLLSIAQMETKEGKSPCCYLGLQQENGFIIDPIAWNSTAKTSVYVFFEWLHVKHNVVSHRAACNINNLTHHGRRVPLNPLRDTSPSGLVFDIQFFYIVAKNIYEKIEFQGTAFEGDCNNILHQLPNDGKDAQHEPVYWVLPDGRAVCWNLVELAKKKTMN